MSEDSELRQWKADARKACGSVFVPDHILENMWDEGYAPADVADPDLRRTYERQAPSRGKSANDISDHAYAKPVD